MIRVRRPKTPPSKLQGDGAAARAALVARYDADPDAFAAWVRETGSSSVFEAGIYGHETVRAALRTCQHDKCAYCEKRREHVQEVEHVRPKARVQQAAGTHAGVPGYFWLAYAWSNLLLACRFCNSRKGTLFPLADPAARARAPHDDLDAEAPLLVRPDEGDPADHITFREHVAVPRTDRGRATIDDVLDLNRERLLRDRLEHFQKLRVLHSVLALDARGLSAEARRGMQAVQADAREELRQATGNTAEFAAMARAALAP
jgi:uncharacterized protein (TIGR02646 family)